MEPTPDVSSFVTQVMNDESMLIAVLTFYVCEAIFAAFPLPQARAKQGIATLVGMVLGLLLLDVPHAQAALQGLLAGGATTVAVAKFKKPSASVTVVEQPVVVPEAAMVTPKPRLEMPAEPVEHL